MISGFDISKGQPLEPSHEAFLGLLWDSDMESRDPDTQGSENMLPWFVEKCLIDF